MNNIKSGSEVRELDPCVETQMYSSKDVASIIVNSFRFSRGSDFTQHRLLSAIVIANRGRLSGELIDASIDEAVSATNAIYMNQRVHLVPENRNHSRTDAEQLLYTQGVVEGYTDAMKTILKDKLTTDTDWDDLSGYLIIADRKWIPEVREAAVKSGLQPAARPYRSNIITHGFLSRSTGLAEYDMIFGAVADRITKMEESPPQIYSMLETEATGLKQIALAHIHYNPADTEPVEAILETGIFDYTKV